MKIHFVCVGNVYRSRFAEAYARSKNTDHDFSSSGIQAGPHQPYGPISWWGARLAYNHSVANYLSAAWTATTQELLSNNDIVVFVHPNVEHMAKNMFDVSGIDYRVWNVEDIYHMDHSDMDTLIQKLDFSDKTGKYITQQVDSLLKTL